ncbi:hypothetical protein THAOC_23953, partial [Thalassiosira oceanica]
MIMRRFATQPTNSRDSQFANHVVGRQAVHPVGLRLPRPPALAPPGPLPRRGPLGVHGLHPRAARGGLGRPLAEPRRGRVGLRHLRRLPVEPAAAEGRARGEGREHGRFEKRRRAREEDVAGGGRHADPPREACDGQDRGEHHPEHTPDQQRGEGGRLCRGQPDDAGGNARNNGSSPQDSRVSFEANDDSKGKSVTPPKTPKFSERVNAGQVVARYNPGDLPSAAEVSSRADGARKAGAGCTVSVHGKANHPTAEFRHILREEERGARGDAEWLGEAMRAGLGVRTEEEEMLEMDLGGEDGGGRDGAKDGGEKDGFVGTWTPVGVPKQNTVVCVGRICNEVSFFSFFIPRMGARRGLPGINDVGCTENLRSGNRNRVWRKTSKSVLRQIILKGGRDRSLDAENASSETSSGPWLNRGRLRSPHRTCDPLPPRRDRSNDQNLTLSTLCTRQHQAHEGRLNSKSIRL